MDRHPGTVVRPLLVVFVVLSLSAGLLGLWVAGTAGALSGIAAMGIGAIIVSASVLLLGQFTDLSEIAWRPVLLAAGAQFAVFVPIQYATGQVLAETTRVLLLVGSSLGIGLVVGSSGGRHRVAGLVHGALAGGIGGMLVILVAIERSFNMQPSLTVIVFISAVVAPILFGALCGLGGLFAGLAREIEINQP